MANRHAEAVARMAQRMKETNPVSITYYRGVTAYALTAFIGQTAFRQTDANTGYTVLRFNDRDYYILKTDLPIEPREGDYILDTGIPSVRFDVLTPEAEQAVRFTDGTRTVWIVRTQAKLI